MRVPSVVFGERGGLEEQEARALAVHEAVREDLEAHVSEQWSRLRIVLVVAAVVAVVGLALLATGRTGLGAGLAGVGVVGGAGAGAYVRSRDPETTVQSVEKGYWTGHVVPDADGAVVFDATESIESTAFELNLLSDPDRTRRIEAHLAEMEEFPVVLTEDHDVEAEFLDSLAAVESEIERSETHEVVAPVIGADDPAVDSLSRLASVADADPVAAGGVSLSREAAAAQVERFDEFESMADEDHGESVLLDVSDRSRELANELSGLQETATKLLNDHVQTAGDVFGLVSYNFYCPDCMDDEIESRLELLDGDGQWYCDTCRSNFAVGDGIARHRIRDEIVLDVWDQLWIEKDDQRREIYESIEDQKSELEEREFEQRREEIRTAEERIKDVRSRIRDLQTEAKAKQGIVREIGRLMEKYDRLNEEKVAEFRDDVTSAFEEIDAETERVLDETEGAIADRIEEAEEQAEKKAEMEREEKRQRDRELMAHREAVAEAQAEAVTEAIAATHANKPERRGN